MNGYFKLPLNGKDRGFKFDNESTGLILKALGISISDLYECLINNPFLVYPIVVMEGLRRNAVKSKTEIPNEEDVKDWVEEEGIMSENIRNIVKAFSETTLSLVTKKNEVKVPNVKGKVKK